MHTVADIVSSFSQGKYRRAQQGIEALQTLPASARLDAKFAYLTSEMVRCSQEPPLLRSDRFEEDLQAMADQARSLRGERATWQRISAHDAERISEYHINTQMRPGALVVPYRSEHSGNTMHLVELAAHDPRAPSYKTTVDPWGDIASVVEIGTFLLRA